MNVLRGRGGGGVTNEVGKVIKSKPHVGTIKISIDGFNIISLIFNIYTSSLLSNIQFLIFNNSMVLFKLALLIKSLMVE